MSVAMAIREVNVKIFYRLWNLLLDASLFLLDFDNAAMGGPVPLNALQSLLEKEGQIHRLLTGDSKALEIYMAVVLGELLEKHSLQVVFIKGLDEAFLVVV